MPLRLRWRARAAALVVVLGAAVLTGCSPAGSEDDALVVWSLESQTERVHATEQIAARFTADTGVPVRIVAVDENQFSQMIMSAAAAGDLPDVIGALPLSAIWQMAGNELLDTRATRDIIRALGAGTFSPRALELTSDGDRQLAVPSDAWAQILVYRKDLFARAGLDRPDTYERIQRAARALDRGGTAGMSVATLANDTATGQAFEGMALANGCQMVDRRGRITLESPPCRETFRFMSDLVSRYSAPGAQDIDSTRATYFAGRSAMMLWSSHLLDELGGLRQEAMPACPRCGRDPLFLARNTGIVSEIQGPSGRPAQYGELSSWAVPVDAKRDARRFVKFMMSERAYPDWLGMAPEGKLPIRTGTPRDPQRFARAWDQLPAGVDTKRRLSELYPGDTLRALRESPDRFRRWGFERNQGVLMGATLGEMPVPQAVNMLLNGSDPDETAGETADEIRSIQTSLR